MLASAQAFLMASSEPVPLEDLSGEGVNISACIQKKKYVFLTPEFSIPQALSACTISHLALTSGTRKFMGLRMSMQPAGPSSLYNHPPSVSRIFEFLDNC